jgi:hypothetical protein
LSLRRCELATSVRSARTEPVRPCIGTNTDHAATSLTPRAHSVLCAGHELIEGRWRSRVPQPLTGTPYGGPGYAGERVQRTPDSSDGSSSTLRWVRRFASSLLGRCRTGYSPHWGPAATRERAGRGVRRVGTIVLNAFGLSGVFDVECEYRSSCIKSTQGMLTRLVTSVDNVAPWVSSFAFTVPDSKKPIEFIYGEQ